MAGHLRRRNGIYWFRRRVPDALRGLLGRVEITRSLHTSSGRLASSRARSLWLASETAFQQMSQTPSLQAAQARILIDRLLAEPLLESPTADQILADWTRTDRPSGGLARLLFNRDAVAVIQDLPPEQQVRVAEHMRSLCEQIEAHVARHGREVAEMRADLETRRSERHRQRADDAEAALAETEVARQVTERLREIAGTLPHPVAPTPDPLPVPAPAQPLAVEAVLAPAARSRSGKASAKPLFSSLVDAHLVCRRDIARQTHQVIGQERGTLRRFTEVCGDRPVDTYDRGDVTHFLNTLRRLPVAYGKSPRDKDLTLARIIERADATGAKRLDDRTVKRHLSALSVFFGHVRDLGHMSAVGRRELVDDHRFRSSKGARNQRDAWTSDELRRLFSSPVWTGSQARNRSQAGPTIIRDSYFWIPLLALYHGSRLEEVADLYGRDVFEDVWQGGRTWAIRVTPTEEDAETGVKERRLKTDNAKRTIPLHPELVRLGFLDYVQTTAPGPDDPVFPDIEPQGADGKRGPRITRWFGEYRRTLGLDRPGVGMHAMRHTAITRLSDVITDEQQKRHRNFIMGHASGGEGDTRYDKGPGLAASAATLGLLRFPEVDLRHLYIE